MKEVFDGNLFSYFEASAFFRGITNPYSSFIASKKPIAFWNKRITTDFYFSNISLEGEIKGSYKIFFNSKPIIEARNFCANIFVQKNKIHIVSVADLTKYMLPELFSEDQDKNPFVAYYKNIESTFGNAFGTSIVDDYEIVEDEYKNRYLVHTTSISPNVEIYFLPEDWSLENGIERLTKMVFKEDEPNESNRLTVSEAVKKYILEDD